MLWHDNLLALRKATRSERATLLQALPRRLHAGVAQGHTAYCTPAFEGHLSIIRQRLQSERQDCAGELRRLRIASIRNAPPGLCKTAWGWMAVPQTSPRHTRETFVSIADWKIYVGPMTLHLRKSPTRA